MGKSQMPSTQSQLIRPIGLIRRIHWNLVLGASLEIWCLMLGASFLCAGCGQPQASVRVPATPDREQKTEDRGQKTEGGDVLRSPSSVPGLPAGFAPVKIGILPLTELAAPAGAGQRTKLHIFVTLLDAFGSPMKAPGVLRFELYEYVPRSAQSKGQRLTLWPDIDLTAPAENHRYWRDFLRAYEFELEAQADRDKTYILEVTCLSPDGRRLGGEYILKSGQ
jgi:hypothetical protein